jgi:hypothetical protein
MSSDLGASSFHRERRLAVLVLEVDACAVLEEHARDATRIAGRCPVQRRVALAVVRACRHIRIRLQQQLRDL